MAEKQSLRMILPLDQLSAFSLLLQQGVWLQVRIGCSVMDLLVGQFGIAENYVVERITTLFMDGKAIDDLENSYVKDGSTVALSSAMPGLVGATMRRGGHLAAMRGAITYRAEQHEKSGAGRIRIKLFNMVMTELGATILGWGISLSHAELTNFLNEQSDSFRQSFAAIMLDDQRLNPANPNEYLRLADPSDEILLQVEFHS
jgi:hypothetical protein